MAPDVDPARLISEVVTILGAVGGLGGIAAILKAFFGRHKGTTVKFGENGEVLQADGLSVDDIFRLLEKCNPRMPADLVVRDACNTDDRKESSPDRIFSGEGFERAMSEARWRSREGSPQEVVEYVDGEPRVIRRYEDGHEVPRRPGCPPWCDQGHDDPHGLPVWHRGEIGTITQPDGAEVSVGIIRDPDGQNQVTVGGWTPDKGFDGRGPRGLNGHFLPSLAMPTEDAVRLAGLADLLGHAGLARHLRNAAVTITAAAPAAGEAGQ